MKQLLKDDTATILQQDNPNMKSFFEEQGYVIIRGLFSEGHVATLRETFRKIAAGGPIPGVFEPRPQGEAERDPLKTFPRVMMPHRINQVAHQAMLNPDVIARLHVLFGETPLAAQSMFYYKPPTARGQALHQDNFFLMVEPDTCIAAWTAIDNIDDENGGMYIVPKTHEADITCPEEADSALSFTKQFVPIPKGRVAKLAQMKAGDTLFFNGSMIHGSGPNRSARRFRRSFIGHYIPASTLKVSRYYLPLLRPDGTKVDIEINDSGGACGDEWQGASH